MPLLLVFRIADTPLYSLVQKVDYLFNNISKYKELLVEISNKKVYIIILGINVEKQQNKCWLHSGENI